MRMSLCTPVFGRFLYDYRGLYKDNLQPFRRAMDSPKAVFRNKQPPPTKSKLHNEHSRVQHEVPASRYLRGSRCMRRGRRSLADGPGAYNITSEDTS